MDLEEVVLKAGSAYSDGNYDEALQLYQRAVLGHPHNAVLHANLAAIFTRLSRYTEALQHAETAVSLEPKWGKAFYRKGEALRQMGDHGSSLLAFCAALHLEPPTRQYLSALKDCVKKVFSSFPLAEMTELGLQDDPFALLATVGQSLLSEGHLPDAIQILTWALQLDCSCKTLRASVMACMGYAYYKMGDPRRAIDYYEQQLELCQELGTDEVSALRSIATAAEAAHEWELALRSRRKIFQNKNFPETGRDDERQAMAELLLQMGRGEEALFMLEMKPPENLRARINLACVRAVTGDGGTALSSLLLLRPSDEELFARALAATCRCFTDGGRLQEAVNYLEDVMHHTTIKGQNHVWKKACSLSCTVHLRMGNMEHALQLAKRLLRVGRHHKDPATESEALRLLATAYSQQGDHQSAVILLQNCVALVKVPVEKAKLHLEIATILKKSDQDPREHIQLAVEAGECSSDSQVKAQTCSAALRHYKEMGEGEMAEELLQRQKDLLHYDLDGTTRSIIFEDLALMTTGESDMSVVALEHSLAEAQEANNMHRELELLERLGDELGRIGKQREAEGFYHRFLALAKQLRIADHIQRGHTKLASEYKTRGEWNLCGEHARSALTLARVQQDIPARVTMLLLIGEAETEKNDLEMAVYTLKKAAALAEASQMSDRQAEAYFCMAKAHRLKGDNERAIEYQKKFIDTSKATSPRVCETLIQMGKQAEPVEKLVYLRKCRDMAKNLDEEEKASQLLACFAFFMELNLVDEALLCLRGEDLPTEKLTCLFDLPLTKQLPILLCLNERDEHDQRIHARLLLLGENEFCDRSPTCQFITAWKGKDWARVLSLDTSSLDLSILASEVIEMIEIMADWHTNRALPICLHQLSANQQRYLHSVTWTHPQWSPATLPWLAPSVDLLSDELSPLEKIVFGVVSSQTELVPMWFEELLATMRTSSFSPFEWDDARRNVLLAAAFIALVEEDSLSQIWILERAKWELDKHLLTCHGLPPPAQVSALLFSQPFNYVISLREVDLIWISGDDGSVELCLGSLVPSPSFHVHTLSRLLRQRETPNLDPSLDTTRHLLVTNSETALPCERAVPWIRDCLPVKRDSRRIWLLNMSHLPLKGAVDTLNKKKTGILRKFADSHVVLLDPQMAPTLHDIISTGPAPDVVLVTGSLPFHLYSALFLRGTATIIQTENPTAVAVQIFVEQLRMGDPISTCASHFKHKLYGDADFRIALDATLAQLRRIIGEDPDSFMLVARSWRQEGKPGEPWSSVAKELTTLSKEQITTLVSLLGDYTTEEVEKMYHRSNVLQDPLLKQQWAMLYGDHLYADQSASRVPTGDKQPKRRSQVEDTGYSSEGEYLVVRRQSQMFCG